MKPLKPALGILMILAFFLPTALSAADTKGSLTCVGLYSETSDGSISYRLGKADWVVVKIGDVIPAAAELRINVDRDWIELIATGSPNKVYDLSGPDSGELVLKTFDILKGKSRTVAFPKKGTATDPAFKDKLVVSQVWGRQVYRANADTPDKDIQYGDVLDIKGKVRIIGINNTLSLMFPNGAVTTIVGPLNFEIQKVFAGSNLYKYLNVTK
jgi:hypothetical protein